MANRNYSYQEQIKKDNRKRENIKNKKNTQYRRNLQSRARKKDWLEYNDENWEEAAPAATQRIMPLDENDRKQRVENSTLEGGGLDLGLMHHTGDEVATVFEVSTGLCRVRFQDEELLCAIRGSITAQETGYSNAIAVGDLVLVSRQEEGRGMVESVLPRKSILARQGGNHRQQIVVANADQILIVAAWRNPHIWPELIDRYLIVAQRNHLSATLAINKIDLAESQDELQAFASIYRNLDVDVLLTSVDQHIGIDLLKEMVKGKTSVLTGLSGVGKSSLLSSIDPVLNLKAKQVSQFSGDGRHTTTQSNLYQLAIGATMIDTPGIREFGLDGISPHELAGFFPEMSAFAPHCRFTDCLHQHEPDCAVQQAVKDGLIAESRYHSYELILEELA